MDYARKCLKITEGAHCKASYKLFMGTALASRSQGRRTASKRQGMLLQVAF